MTPILWLGGAAAIFVASHFLLSHPLRAPVVGLTGERGFLGLYSLVAAASLAWTIVAFLATPAGTPLWGAGEPLWALVSLIMLLASVLLIGSFVRNPALPRPGASSQIPPQARDVFTITRHPMMWAIGLWAICHAAVWPTPRNLVLCAAIAVLALAGAALQDAKKRRAAPGAWTQWEAETSFWPFAAVAAGKARLGGFGPLSLVGGVGLWLAATWAHGPLGHVAVGIWRWF